MSIERHMQGQEAYLTGRDAMGYRIAEMKDLLTQRDLRMEGADVRDVLPDSSS